MAPAPEMTVSRFGMFCLFVFRIPAPLSAHHSFFAEFDEKHPVKVTGTITRVEWENPHVWYYLDVKGADGKVTTWGFSMNAPGQLMRSGLTKDMLKLGALITAEGFRAKDGSNNANSQRITLPDQQSVVTGTQGDSAEDKSKN
jgi:hypothetical protein